MRTHTHRYALAVLDVENTFRAYHTQERIATFTSKDIVEINDKFLISLNFF